MKPTRIEMIAAIDKWMRFKSRKLKMPGYYPRKQLFPKLKRWKWGRLVMVVKILCTDGTLSACPYCLVWGFFSYSCYGCEYREINGKCLEYGAFYDRVVGKKQAIILEENSTQDYFNQLFSSLKERLTVNPPLFYRWGDFS